MTFVSEACATAIHANTASLRRRLQQCNDLTQRIAHAKRFRRLGFRSIDDEHLLGDLADPFDLVLHACDIRVVLVLRRHGVFDQRERTGDSRERIVNLVRDTCRDSARRHDFLGLDSLAFKFADALGTLAHELVQLLGVAAKLVLHLFALGDVLRNADNAINLAFGVAQRLRACCAASECCRPCAAGGILYPSLPSRLPRTRLSGPLDARR